MKRPQPETEEAPRPEKVVVVQSLRLEMGILFMEPVEDYPKGKVITCYGGYGSIRYIPGHMPKDLRAAAIEEDYCHEVIVSGFLPDRIEEIDLDEYPPGAMKMVVMDAEIIEAPFVERAPEPQCKVIKHWASYGVQPDEVQPEPQKLPKSKKKKKVETDPNQIAFYLPEELKPINQTA